MASDRAQKLEEIEVTPEMIAVGIRALSEASWIDGDGSLMNPEDVCAAVFRAMDAARRVEEGT